VAILASDNFTRANNADLGTNWDPENGGFAISSNTAVPTAAGLDSSESWTSGPVFDNQYSQVTLGPTSADGVDLGCGATCNAAGGATLQFYRLVGNASGWGLLRFLSGGSTLLASGSNVTFASGDKLRLVSMRVGANISLLCYKNGVLFTSFLDSASPLPKGKFGIAYSATATTASLTAFEGGVVEVTAGRGDGSTFVLIPLVQMKDDGKWDHAKSVEYWW
jgi:hypothetical protein